MANRRRPLDSNVVSADNYYPPKTAAPPSASSSYIPVPLGPGVQQPTRPGGFPTTLGPNPANFPQPVGPPASTTGRISTLIPIPEIPIPGGQTGIPITPMHNPSIAPPPPGTELPKHSLTPQPTPSQPTLIQTPTQQQQQQQPSSGPQDPRAVGQFTDFENYNPGRPSGASLIYNQPVVQMELPPPDPECQCPQTI